MPVLTPRDQRLLPWLHALAVALFAGVGWLLTKEIALVSAIVLAGARFSGALLRRAADPVPTPPPTQIEDLQRTRVLAAQRLAEETIHDVVNDLAAVQGKFDLIYRQISEITAEQRGVQVAGREVILALRSIRDEIEQMVARVRRARSRLGLLNGFANGGRT